MGITDVERLLEPVTGDVNVAVMVTSLDGIVAIDGHVGDLTGPADQRLLLGMRERAIAVVAGAATIRAEGYGRLLPAAAQQKRAAAGRNLQPELVTVSRSPHGVDGTDAAGATDLDLNVDVPPQLPGDVPDLRAVSDGIRDRHGSGVVSWEGGPTIVRMAIGQAVIDELFLAVSPIMAGAGKPFAGPMTGTAAKLTLLGSAVSGDFVFLRYGVGYGA